MTTSASYLRIKCGGCGTTFCIGVKKNYRGESESEARRRSLLLLRAEQEQADVLRQKRRDIVEPKDDLVVKK